MPAYTRWRTLRSCRFSQKISPGSGSGDLVVTRPRSPAGGKNPVDDAGALADQPGTHPMQALAGRVARLAFGEHRSDAIPSTAPWSAPFRPPSRPRRVVSGHSMPYSLKAATPSSPTPQTPRQRSSGNILIAKFIFLWKTTPAVLTFDLRAKFRIQIAGFEDQVIGRFDVRVNSSVFSHAQSLPASRCHRYKSLSSFPLEPSRR